MKTVSWTWVGQHDPDETYLTEQCPSLWFKSRMCFNGSLLSTYKQISNRKVSFITITMSRSAAMKWAPILLVFSCFWNFKSSPLPHQPSLSLPRGLQPCGEARLGHLSITLPLTIHLTSPPSSATYSWVYKLSKQPLTKGGRFCNSRAIKLYNLSVRKDITLGDAIFRRSTIS